MVVGGWLAVEESEEKPGLNKRRKAEEPLVEGKAVAAEEVKVEVVVSVVVIVG